MDRRRFLKTAAAGAVATAVGCGKTGHSAFDSGRMTWDLPLPAPIPRRTLGKTDEDHAMLVLGGWHIGSAGRANGQRLVDRALELGIDFIDSADCYQGGESERIIGEAMRGRRDAAYLMTKVDQRDKAGSQKQLEISMRNMQLDMLDLWQFHAVSTVAEVDRIFGPGGAFETAQAAKRAGRIRHVGITGHVRPEALVHALEHYHAELDTVQFPVNVCDPSYSSFIEQVLPLATKHNVGVIAMKTVAGGTILARDFVSVEDCLAYAWSQPVGCVVSGMETLAKLEQNVRAAVAFEPLAPDRQHALVALASNHAGRGVETYKAAV